MTLAERNKAFGAKILELRTALGLSQRKLGEQVGLSSGFMSRLERGLYDPPSEEKIVALASALRTNPDSLLGLAGKAPSRVTEQIAKKPEQLSEGVRLLDSIDLEKLGVTLAMIALIGLLLSESREKKPRTDEYKKRWGAAFDKFKRESAHLTRQEKQLLINELKRLIIEWEKSVNAG